MSIVSSSAGSNTAAGGTDVFDMTALKAVVAGAGTSAAYQPPMQSKPRSQLNTEHWEGAERDTEVVAAVAAGPTVGASGGGGGGDEDGQNTAGAAARAAAQPSIAPPADEKENMDPVCRCTPSTRDYAMLVRRNPECVAVDVRCMREVFPQRSDSLDAHLSSPFPVAVDGAISRSIAGNGFPSQPHSRAPALCRTAGAATGRAAAQRY